MSIGFCMSGSTLNCSTVMLPMPGSFCKTASAASCGALKLLALLPCTLHSKHVCKFLHAVLIWIWVVHCPQSRSKHACSVLSRPLAGTGCLLLTDQCCCTAAGNGSAGLPLFCLQTVENKPAKGCTKMEWADVMGRFQLIVTHALRRLPAAGPLSFGGRPIWSYDNDKIHQEKMLQHALHMWGRSRFPLPAHSHDMHRVVEHCLGRLKRDFKAWYYNHPQQRSMAEYRQALKHLFYTNQTAAVISADVADLPSVFNAIKENGGDWPARKFQ